MPANYLGIEIGGTKLQLMLGDPALHDSFHQQFKVDAAKGAAGIRELIAKSIEGVLSKTAFDAVGVGFGGPVDWRTGRICRSHQIEGWSEFDLRGWLEPLCHAPVFVDNDANVAALGEATNGAGRNRNPVFYVTLGSGVGGGLVADGKIYHGATPGESEIGHLRLDRHGTTVESRCSGWAVDAQIHALKDSHPKSLLAQAGKNVSGNEASLLPAAIAQKDPAALNLLRDVAEDLAFGLSHVVQLFHPQMIVIGGGLSNLGEPLRAAVERALRPHIMEAFAPGPEIVLSVLRENAVPFGALELARRGLA